MHQFSVGEVVTVIPDMFLRHAAPGDYKIIASMPDRDGEQCIGSEVLLKNMNAPLGKAYSSNPRAICWMKFQRDGRAGKQSHWPPVPLI
jgi:hypothetical protein